MVRRLQRQHPERYVQAYRHVHDIFTEVGVTNVKWNWSVNIVSDTTVPIDQLHPGDAYVDEVGIDGYNGGTEQDWGGWTMFGDLFGPGPGAGRADRAGQADPHHRDRLQHPGR